MIAQAWAFKVDLICVFASSCSFRRVENCWGRLRVERVCIYDSPSIGRMVWRRSFALLVVLGIVFSLGVQLVDAHGGASDDGDDEDTGGEAVNYRRKSLILVKVYCLIIVFVGTFAGGVSPYFMRWSTGFLVLGVQFAGGIFLATALEHFLSDSNETFEARTTKEYPFAFMLACVGYLVTMLGDVTIGWVYSRRAQLDGAYLESSKRDPKNPVAGSEVVPNNDNEFAVDVPHPTISTRMETAAALPTTNLGDTILLIMALCFHSVFEGIAIGVAGTAYDAWRNLWTVSLHKIFAAISMGIALLRMLPNRPLLSCASYSFAFAISTPIGIAIGIAIDATTQGPVADWIYAISMGLAAGVFVYVAINHLLTKGFFPLHKTAVDTPAYKFLAVTLGVAVMSVVMIWD